MSHSSEHQGKLRRSAKSHWFGTSRAGPSGRWRCGKPMVSLRKMTHAWQMFRICVDLREAIHRIELWIVMDLLIIAAIPVYFVHDSGIAVNLTLSSGRKLCRDNCFDNLAFHPSASSHILGQNCTWDCDPQGAPPTERTHQKNCTFLTNEVTGKIWQAGCPTRTGSPHPTDRSAVSWIDGHRCHRCHRCQGVLGCVRGCVRKAYHNERKLAKLTKLTNKKDGCFGLRGAF